VIFARVGLERINASLRSLGLERTVVAGDCAHIGQAIMDAVGASSPEDLPPLEDPEVRRRLLACRALDPGVTTRTTPRELTALLAMIWRGEAGLAASRNGVSWLMAQQFCHARMAGAFPFPPWVGAKSGSLPPDVVNEAGAVDYLDGRRFAVAVFTRGRPVGQPLPADQPRGAVGRAIGEVAHLAVGLRGRRPGMTRNGSGASRAALVAVSLQAGTRLSTGGEHRWPCWLTRWMESSASTLTATP
jgi:beta-lactamase class A